MTAQDESPNGKRVWVIGAGASVGHSHGLFPTLAMLPRKSVETGALAGFLQGPGIGELERFCLQHYGSTFQENLSLNWEEIFTTLDISIALTPTPDRMAARDTLAGVIRNTMRLLHDDWREVSGTSGGHSSYDTLRTVLHPNDTLITFNWDTLLDDVLGRLHILNDRHGAAGPYLHFLDQFTGVEGASQSEMGRHVPVQAWDPSRSYYLKLHGSLDWFACENARCYLLDTIFPMVEYGTAPLCGACIEPMRPLIVPPTLDKKLHTNSWTRRLWAIAAREIGLATTIVIWGYSLPPTDFYSNWLLRQTSSDRLKVLAVVNPALIERGKPPEGTNELLQGLLRDWVKLGHDFLQHLTRVLPSSRKFLSVRLFETAEDYFADLPIERKYPSLADDVRIYLMGAGGR